MVSCSDKLVKEEEKIIDFDFNITDLSGYHGSESEFRFLRLISSNSIDEHYDNVMNKLRDGYTSLDLIDNYNELIKIWTEEFEYSYARYAELLEPDERDNYINAQKDWYNSIFELYRITGKSSKPAWSDFEKESMRELMIEIRRHTLFIKYNEYVNHIVHDPESEFIVRFKYQ